MIAIMQNMREFELIRIVGLETLHDKCAIQQRMSNVRWIIKREIYDIDIQKFRGKV